MTGGIVLGIRLRFHDHTPEQAAVVLAFHQPAAHQVWSNHLCWTAEEGLRKGWEIFKDQLVGDGSFFGVDEGEARGLTQLHFTQGILLE